MAAPDDLVKTLANVFKIKGEIDDLMNIPKAVNISLKTHASGQLMATNDDLNKLRAIGRNWCNQLIKLSLKDDNWWVEWSGTHALSVHASQEAIRKILELQNWT
jgi:hypothetical protein